MELGRDYMHAGLYDRAERLFLEAIDIGGKSAAPSLKHLLTIYQHEKEWEKAIEYAKLLESQMNEPSGKSIAHYYCELIELRMLQLTDVKFKEYLDNAYAADPQCVRVSLSEARWHERHGDLKAAIKAYKRVKDQDPDYLAETIQPITECYTRLRDEAGLRDYLYQCLNESPQLPVILTITEKLQQWHDNKVAADFIAEQLRIHPSIQGLARLVEFYVQDTAGESKRYMESLHRLMQHFLRDKAAYQCHSCGFTSKNLEWLCPGCKNWNTIKPIKRLEQEFAR
jgi:lipopolysaccharide biosynthesis regulator YciM